MQEMPVGAAQETAPAEGAGGDVGRLIVETDKNLAMIAKAAQGGGLPEELAQGFAQLSEQFRSLVDAALSASEGGEAAPDAPQPRAAAEGMAPAEAGGNPRARPMSMGG